MYYCSLPLRIDKLALNMNVYRNTHYAVLNKAKVKFKKEVSYKLTDIPKMNQIKLIYIYYPGSSRLSDTNNVCSIVDKFFCDVLVDLSIIPDDSYNHLIETSFKFGSVDKLNPRVDVEICLIN